jgi:beta-glucanase (GH16 family)
MRRNISPFVWRLLCSLSVIGCGPLDDEPVASDAVAPLATGNPPASCAGHTCSGHGVCVVTSGIARCNCNPGYHASDLSCFAGASDPGTAFVPSGYHLVFSDEFASSALDRSKWNTLAPWGVQFYEDSKQRQAFVPDAVTLKNGYATLTAADASNGNAAGQPYTSGSLTTNRAFTGGYFEARVRVPAGKGFWPAFWLTSTSRWPPEWDIFEIIDGVIFGSKHPVAGGKCTFIEGAAGADSTYQPGHLYDVFHVYGFKWTSTDLYWYVDSVLTQHYAIDAAAGAKDAMWLNLSLQVGGDWPGEPDGTTPFPSHMDVDYLRVYQR